MKYTTTNPPMKCFMRQSSWYKGAGKTTIKGVLWHSTGANNPNLKRYVQPDDNASDKVQMLALLGTNKNHNDWNHVSLQAGVHAFIGKLASGEVTTVQVGDWNKQAWGCGPGKKGSCNNGWIQFEICEDSLSDPAYFEKVYREAVELTAYLCKLYGLNPYGTVTYCGVKVPVILCHQDSYRLGLGSNHGDVLHWFSKFGKTMDNVRNDVAALMGTSSGTVTNDTDVNYQGQVTAKSGLNCRTAPVSGNVIMTYPYETVVTVTKERDGWGFTGTGWVSLEYIQKISSTQTNTKTEEDDDNMTYYKTLADVPSYYKDAVQKAASKGVLNGTGNGELNVSEDLCRILTILNRLGKLD